MDPNQNGYLSLAELDLGVKKLLNCEKLFKSKPALLRAFKLAKNANPQPKKSIGFDYVEPSEFRTFLIALRQYFEYFIMFEKVNVGVGIDRRLDLTEFKEAQRKFKKWGVNIDNPTKIFNQIDKNKGGFILFDEFADWAIDNQLDLASDNGQNYLIDKKQPSQYLEEIHLNYKKKSLAMVDEFTEVWKELDEKLPLDDSKQDKERRKKMFQEWDPNKNGYLSLAEVDLGIKKLLACEKLFKSKPALIRAFQRAKLADIKPKNKKLDTGKDRKVNLLEFKSAVKKLQTWGVEINDPSKIFNQIDKNQGGEILFDEFTDWAIDNKLELKYKSNKKNYTIDKNNPSQYLDTF